MHVAGVSTGRDGARFREASSQIRDTDLSSKVSVSPQGGQVRPE